jgi:hypothetical protein
MSKTSSRGTPSERVKTAKDDKLRVFETYLRALEKLSSLTPDVEALEEEVAGREVEVLKKVLALMAPVVERIARPVVLREPWIDDSVAHEGHALREPGIVLSRSFKQEREKTGSHLHRSQGLVLVARGRLIEFEETARWTEPERRDATWRVEASEVDVTPEFARERLAPILAAVLDALREALATEVENKRELKERLLRIAEAEKALG